MSKSLANTAYDLIKVDIINCVLLPGSTVIQGQLASKYKIGITPIREALKRLEHEGLVTSIPNSGFVVSHITISYVQAMFEVRKIVEGGAVRLAALRATQGQIKRISELAEISYEYGDLQSYTKYIKLNGEFHKRVAEASGNPKLADIVAKIHDEMARVFLLGLTVADAKDRLEHDHQSLLRAIVERNPDKAFEVSNREIDYATERVREALNRLLSGEPATGWLAGITLAG